jgi:hypothetical protein
MVCKVSLPVFPRRQDIFYSPLITTIGRIDYVTSLSAQVYRNTQYKHEYPASFPLGTKTPALPGVFRTYS